MLLLQLSDDVPLLLQAPMTLLIVIATVFISYRAFNSETISRQLIFNAYHIRQTNEWYRFFSAGLIHANWLHLALNMFVLWEFGKLVEVTYVEAFGQLGRLFYVILYVAGLGASSIYSYYRHRDNPYYNALGASGAVSGIVFAFILFFPTLSMTFMFLPFIKVPAVVMGVGYLIYSSYMSRRGGDNIGHDAHFWGSVWGFLFTLALDYRLLFLFIAQIQMALTGRLG